jgi:hypothetical protein
MKSNYRLIQEIQLFWRLRFILSATSNSLDLFVPVASLVVVCDNLLSIDLLSKEEEKELVVMKVKVQFQYKSILVTMVTTELPVQLT